MLAIIGKSATTSPDGHLQWSTFDLQKFESALRSTIAVVDPDDNEMTGLDSWGIFHEAMMELIRAAPAMPILGRDLLAKADAAAARFFRRPKLPYVVVTSLGVDNLPFKRIRINDCTIEALPKGRRKYPFPDRLLRAVTDSIYGQHLQSTSYLWLRISTTNRTTVGAIEESIAALNFLRGIWSVLISYRSWSFSLGGSPGPRSIGSVHLGPLHTIRNPDGSNAELNIYWFQPEYLGDLDITRISPKVVMAPKNWTSC